jgi:hypothetical protein
MSSAAWTALFTVLGGVIVFVVGQFVQRFLLEPIQDQRRVTGEIAFVLLYHGNVGRFQNEAHRNEVGMELRRLAGELRATRSKIPFYRLLEKTGWIPTTGSVIKASSGLVGWSNAVFGGHEDSISHHKETVREQLNIINP